jgi:hypothetical protein
MLLPWDRQCLCPGRAPDYQGGFVCHSTGGRAQRSASTQAPVPPLLAEDLDGEEGGSIRVVNKQLPGQTDDLQSSQRPKSQDNPTFRMGLWWMLLRPFGVAHALGRPVR